MKKKFLIVFLICCMFFGVASPAFAVPSYMYEPFPGYDLSVSVGSTQLSSGLYLNETLPQFLVFKDNYPLGVGIQTKCQLDYQIDVTPPNVYAAFDNDIFTIYIEDNDRLIDDVASFILFKSDQSNMHISYSTSSLMNSGYQEINGLTYFVGTIDISYRLSGHASSLDDFTNGNDVSTIRLWNNGPTTQLVGELPPQMMNLGITQVEVPVGQQVVGNLRILLPFGIGLLALLTGLLLLSKVLRRFQR